MMLKEKTSPKTLSEFMQYLANLDRSDAQKLPSLPVLSRQLGISVSSLREQLEVARALGLVEVRPHRGIRRLPYSFFATIKQSMAYALLTDPNSFQYYSDLRNHIEAIYWDQAASLLLPEDTREMYNLIDIAESKLHGDPIQIPQLEHRELHLLIYQRLENPFVIGMLEAYWDMYEAAGLNVYADYQYLDNVWMYHRRMVDAICDGDLEKGKQLLVEHFNLISQRSEKV